MAAGAGTAVAERPEPERQPKRKKGRSALPSCSAAACSLPELARAALDAVLCTLAACTDAARLGGASPADGSPAGEEQEDLLCSQLALSLLTWLRRLPEEALSGMFSSMEPDQLQAICSRHEFLSPDCVGCLHRAIL